MEDPVEPRPHQEDDVGLLQCQGARRRDRERMVVRHDTLAHRRTQERDLSALEKGAHLILGARPGHPLADKDERPLGLFEQVQRVLDVLLRRHRTRRVGRPLDLDNFVLVALAGDDVVGHVEIGGAGTAIDGVPRRHFDIVKDALHGIDGMRGFAEGGGDHHLALLLEGSHLARTYFSVNGFGSSSSKRISPTPSTITIVLPAPN